MLNCHKVLEGHPRSSAQLPFTISKVDLGNCAQNTQTEKYTKREIHKYKIQKVTLMCAQLSQGDRGPPALIDTIHKLDLGERNQIVYTKYTQIQNTKVQKVTLLCAELSQGDGGPAPIGTITSTNSQSAN